MLIADVLGAIEAAQVSDNDDWVWTSPSFPRFERIFRDLQSEIREGRLQKGVPFAFERAHIPGPDGLSPGGLHRPSARCWRMPEAAP